MKKCVVCGSEYESYDDMCYDCGVELKDEKEAVQLRSRKVPTKVEREALEPRLNDWHYMSVGIMAVLGLFGLFYGFVYMFSDSMLWGLSSVTDSWYMSLVTKWNVSYNYLPWFYTPGVGVALGAASMVFGLCSLFACFTLAKRYTKSYILCIGVTAAMGIVFAANLILSKVFACTPYKQVALAVIVGLCVAAIVMMVIYYAIRSDLVDEKWFAKKQK